MKITEVILPHTEADDKHFQQMLSSLWQRHSSPEWQATWPFKTITQIGQVTVIGNNWPPALRSVYFFLDPQSSPPKARSAAPSPIGFANLHKGGRDGDYQNDPRYGVTMIWIAPEYRNQGIAKGFYDFLQAQGIGLVPDTKQSAGGAALWKDRKPAAGSDAGLSVRASESTTKVDVLHTLVEQMGSDGDAYFNGPQVTAAWNEARNPRSRYTISYMSPQDFMSVAEPGFDPQKWQNVQGYLQRKEPFPTLPFIGFDENGRVLSHEGRHRMKAMHQLGVQQVPVVLRSSVHRWGDPNSSPRPTHLHPQTRGHGQPIQMPASAVFPSPPPTR